MPDEQKTQLRLEIAHVLFIDIVGYSKLLIDEQSEALHELNQIVRNTEVARGAEAAGQLIILPTGDGMALVFTGSVEDPVECALQISHTLRAQPSLPVRMGIHSGPVHHVADVNQRDNIAGAGINIAQRVMDCGDAGHILVSKRVADDLAQYRRWQPYLHEVGDIEVKHGVVVSVVNLYADIVGNPASPAKFKAAPTAMPAATSPKPKRGMPWHEVVLATLLLIGLVVAAIFFVSHRAPQQARSAVPIPPSPAAAALPEKSLAVLPFENLSEDKANEFFTNGVQDEILSHLAKVADLKVISRTSVMQYKTGTPRNLREIAQQLGVAHLVEGSVQRAGNKVRVIAQLIDARNDAHLWAQTYDRDLADVFAIQSEIAKSIADQLQARLSPAEKSAIEQQPTSDVVAFELYNRAKDLILNIGFGSTQLDKIYAGIDLCNQALARDPSFFAAQCQLVYAYDELYAILEHTAERKASAEAAIKAALQLRPDAGEAHLAHAFHLYYVYRDYDGALAELEMIRGTMPNAPEIFELTGYIARRRGAHEQGVRNLERAVELDPRNFNTIQQLALSYKILRHYDQEIALEERALSIKPDDDETKVARGVAFLDWKGDSRPLHHAIDEIRTKSSEAIKTVADGWFKCALAERDAPAAEAALTALGSGIAFGDSTSAFSVAFGRGLVARMMKDENKARFAFNAARAEQVKVVQTQADYGPAICVLAVIDAGLGRKEEALRESRRAVELLPVEKDSLDGSDMIQYSAVAAAWVGEKELALQSLAKAAQLPGYVSYGRLKLLPWWDPLRGDPRFEKIVASLAPKE